MIESDGVDDVCISVNSSPSKVINCNAAFNNGLPIVSSSVLCAKASMLLQVSFILQLRNCFFLLNCKDFDLSTTAFYCLVGCFSTSAPTVYEGTTVTVG